MPRPCYSTSAEFMKHYHSTSMQGVGTRGSRVGDCCRNFEGAGAVLTHILSMWRRGLFSRQKRVASKGKPATYTTDLLEPSVPCIGAILQDFAPKIWKKTFGDYTLWTPRPAASRMGTLTQCIRMHHNALCSGKKCQSFFSGEGLWRLFPDREGYSFSTFHPFAPQLQTTSHTLPPWQFRL